MAKSEVRSWAGRIAEIICLLVKEIQKRGMDADEVFIRVLANAKEKIKKTIDLWLEVDVIVRVVAGINRDCTGRELIDTVVASGRKLWYKDQQAVDAIPRGEGDNAKFYYVKLGKYCKSRAEVIARLAELGYMLFQDPKAVAEDMIQNPELADENPIICFWGDRDWATFDRFGDGRYVNVSRSEDDWIDRWSVACVRKYQG